MSFLDLSDVKEGKKSEEKKEWEPIPKGNYDLRCNEVQIGETKKKREGSAQKGRYIKAQFKVNTGEHENRVVYHYFNFENDNETAERIGKEQIKAFLKGSGYDTPEDLKDLQDLVGQVCPCIVDVEPGNDFYGPSNKIKKFLTESKDSADELPF